MIVDPGGDPGEKTRAPVDFMSAGAQPLLANVPPPAAMQYPSPGESFTVSKNGSSAPSTSTPEAPVRRVREMPPGLRQRGVQIMICVMLDGSREIYR